MKDFLISTDTTADLPDSYVKENNIDIHTLFYAFGEVIYGTDNIMPEKEFFDRMRNGDMPTTMACNPEDCKTIFEKRVKEGFDIVVGIDIYFLHTFPVNPFFQEREACHILVEVFA